MTANFAETDAALRAAGLKATQGRRRVLEVLRGAVRPGCHAEIEAALNAGDTDSPPLDRVTLYRILDSLVGAGLALKAADTRGVFRFSATGGQGPHTAHTHFRCLRCGGVFCLKGAPPPAPRLPRGFRLAAVEFDVRGTCALCQRNGTAAR